MSEPTILDASGNPLAVGMRVKSARGDGALAKVYPGGPGRPYPSKVLIRRDGAHSFLAAVVFNDASDTYRCPDLKAVLTPDPEETL
jgi:hypothetical protein